MATEADVRQLNNRSDASGRTPVVKLMAQPLPARLRAIDPVGCEEWEKKQQAQFDEWVKKLNVTVPV